jgi:3-carboxy-cis,cis-muconate cycloisomerase
MPTTLDCKIMGNVFGSPRMREVFSSESLLQSWLDVWAALAAAEAEVGLIPAAAAEKIGAVAKAENFDLDQISRGIDEGRHILMPAIRALTRAAGDSGKFVHWGATTNDITDTGLILQIRQALDLIEPELRKTISILVTLARRYRSHAMAARTHWQHALPITFGFKVALWIDELGRHSERLAESRSKILIAQIGGGAGTLASLGAKAADVQIAFARRLKLQLPDAPWYTLRDRSAELISNIGLLAATMERINSEIGRLSGTEIGELSEPQTKTQVGSSTMPQKVNPIVTERVAATCKIIRGMVPIMQSLMLVTHERDASAMTAEWLVVPQTLIMIDGVLAHSNNILSGLQVFPARMTKNLGLTEGAIVAEAVMMGLAEHIGREEAHEIMIAAAKQAAAKELPLIDVLLAYEKIRESLSEAELRSLVDPNNHLGLAEAIVDKVTARALASQSSLTKE